MTRTIGARASAGATAAMLLAVVLAWVNGILVRTVTVHVEFFGDTADRGDYRVAAGAGLATGVLLLLGMAAVRTLGAPVWLQYAAAAGAATQLALGVTAWWSSRPEDDSEVVSRSVWGGAKDVLELPGSWLLLLVLVIAVERAVRRTRRAE